MKQNKTILCWSLPTVKGEFKNRQSKSKLFYLKVAMKEKAKDRYHRISRSRNMKQKISIDWLSKINHCFLQLVRQVQSRIDLIGCLKRNKKILNLNPFSIKNLWSREQGTDIKLINWINFIRSSCKLWGNKFKRLTTNFNTRTINIIVKK